MFYSVSCENVFSLFNLLPLSTALIPFLMLSNHCIPRINTTLKNKLHKSESAPTTCILILKYPCHKRKQCSLGKWLILTLWQEIYKMRPKHLAMAEIKKVLRKKEGTKKGTKAGEIKDVLCL